MKTIYKYKLSPLTNLDLPEDAEPLTVQMQNGVACLWVRLDTDQPKKQRTFHVIGTGHNLDHYLNSNLEYIATFQMHGGELVFHVFEQVTTSENAQEKPC